jgi:hypothetical protein
MPQPLHVSLHNWALDKLYLLGNEIHKIKLSSQDATKNIGIITSPKDGHTFVSEQAIVTQFTKL